MPQTEQGSFFAPGSHTSYIGALRADSKKGRKLRAYLLYLGHISIATDHEAKDALALPLQSICSLRNLAIRLGLAQKGFTQKIGPFGAPNQTWTLTPAGALAVKTMTEAA